MSQYSMAEPIMTYLDRIHTQFHAYLKEGRTLCNMRKLNYSGGGFPVYNDVNFQRYYLLRYAYAYAFEYKKIYEALTNLPQEDRLCLNKNNQVAVTSIGCGAMLDYWGLARFLENCGVPNIPISYSGIDIVNWDSGNRIQPRIQDDVRYYQEDAIEFLRKKPSLDSHVYFFPKSISEFSDSQFLNLCTLFEKKPISFDRLHVIVSVRENEKCTEIDCKRVQALKDAILKNGFELHGSDGLYSMPEPGKKIWEIDGEFKCPSNIIETVTNLYQYCGEFHSDDESCGRFGVSDDCINDLNRFPIIYAKYVRFIILTFKRKTV